MASELLLSLDDAARRLSLSRRFVQGLIYQGALHSVKVGRCRRIAVADLLTYVDSLREEATPMAR